MILRSFVLILFFFLFITQIYAADNWCIQDSTNPPCNGAPGRCTINFNGNKGGFVANSATIETVMVSGVTYIKPYIGLNATICDHVYITDQAHVTDHARATDHAWIAGDARVTGNAWVYGDARIFGTAWITGDAWVYGDAEVYGNAWVYGNARIFGTAQVSGYARVYGDAQIFGNQMIGTGDYGF